MKQYAGDYQKYTKQYAGQKSSTGSSQGGDYQNYMKQYAGNYQKYTKQYAGQSSGSSQGGDYQKYMKQYASDYQKYMNQSASSAVALYSDEQSKTTNQGGGYQMYMKEYAGQNGSYQKYMKQYAGDYQKYTKQYAGQNSGGSSQGGDYQKYMKQYAGDYQKYTKQYAGQSSSGSSQGGDYQKYMEQYAGDYQKYMNQSSSSAVELYTAEQAKTKSQLEDWKKSQSKNLDKYVPKDYQHYALENIDKQYKKRLQELENTTASGSSIDLAEMPAVTLYSIDQAKNKHQLAAWKKSQTHSIDKYVPSAYRHYATQNIDKQYEKRLHELDNSSDMHAVDAINDYSLNLEELPTHNEVTKNASAHRKKLQQRAEMAVQHVEQIASTIKVAAKDRAAIQKRAALPAQHAANRVAKQRAAVETEMASVKAKIQQGTVDKDDLQKIKHAEASIDALERAEQSALRAETHNAEMAVRHAARGTQASARRAAREARKQTDTLAHVASDQADELDRRAESAAEDAENYGEQLARSNEDELRRQMNEAQEQVRKQADRNRESLSISKSTRSQKASEAQKDAHFLESADSNKRVWGAGSAVLLTAAGACALLAVLVHRSISQRTMPRVPEGQLG